MSSEKLIEVGGKRMRTIVVADLEKVDFQTTLPKVTPVDSIDQLTNENEIYLIESLNVSILNENSNVYIPSTLLKKADDNVYVYFDLEQYPFYQKVKEMIGNPKGVLRFRRIISKAESSRIAASDLYVFMLLLGEPKHVQVKRTNHEVKPYHLIVMVDFGEGTMAHLEYTFYDKERIELEWSGIGNIIEFNSEEMTPVNQQKHVSLPLLYNVDSVLKYGKKANQDLVDRLEKFNEIIFGGVD